MCESPDAGFRSLDAHVCLCPVSPEHLHQLLTNQVLETVDGELVQGARHTADVHNVEVLRALVVI